MARRNIAVALNIFFVLICFNTFFLFFPILDIFIDSLLPNLIFYLPVISLLLTILIRKKDGVSLKLIFSKFKINIILFLVFLLLFIVSSLIPIDKLIQLEGSPPILSLFLLGFLKLFNKIFYLISYILSFRIALYKFSKIGVLPEKSY